MSFAKPKITAPTPEAPPADQGADALQVGGSANSPLTTAGNVGRLALRVGNPMASTS